MPYTLPTFNLAVNIWRPGAPPPAPPALVTIGNLAHSRREHGELLVPPAPGYIHAFNMWLLLPALTDVRDPFANGGAGDLVECPAGSGRMYAVLAVDDAAKGFANEHRVAVLLKLNGWPVPNP